MYPIHTIRVHNIRGPCTMRRPHRMFSHPECGHPLPVETHSIENLTTDKSAGTETKPFPWGTAERTGQRCLVQAGNYRIRFD